MRVGLVATLSTPVRAVGSGSVEGLVALLARELLSMGHEVTVFGADRSVVPGADVVTVPGTYGEQGMPQDYLQCELMNLASAVERSDGLDVLHTHAYLLGRLLERLTPIPMVHTLHTQPYESEAALARLPGSAGMTALSRYQWSAFGDVAATVVPNAVDTSAFTFRPHPEERLCYFGRFLPEKGPLVAIRVARDLGIPLLLAGPANDYYETVVRPLVDGTSVEYVGTVDGPSRDDLLGGSAALLYPVSHGEPFGLVMAEAMVCGTPITATPVGAAPEVVEDGVTGRLAPVEALAAATRDALRLDRRTVREVALTRFSSRRMARQYEAVYAGAVAGGSP